MGEGAQWQSKCVVQNKRVFDERNSTHCGINKRRNVAVQKRATRRSKATRDALVTNNDKLVHAVAKRYRHFSNHADLVQEGRIGLIHAARTWNKKKGAFSTHATKRIRAHVQRGLGGGFQVRVPERKLKTVAKPHVAALSDAFQVTTDGGISRAHARASVSRLHKRLGSLPKQQARVLRARYFVGSRARPEPLTTRQVAKRLQVTAGRVSQLEKAARKRLTGNR